MRPGAGLEVWDLANRWQWEVEREGLGGKWDPRGDVNGFVVEQVYVWEGLETWV